MLGESGFLERISEHEFQVNIRAFLACFGIIALHHFTANYFEQIINLGWDVDLGNNEVKGIKERVHTLAELDIVSHSVKDIIDYLRTEGGTHIC